MVLFDNSFVTPIIVGAVIGKDAVKGSKGISMGVDGPQSASVRTQLTS